MASHIHRSGFLLDHMVPYAFFWYLETFNMIPTEASAKKSAVPPCEMNRSGVPESGMIASIAAMLRND